MGRTNEMGRTPAFDADKAVEAILYVAPRVGDPSFHRISKILYFADKEHLSRYGRLICGDRYVAMKHGPVPSGVYDILKHVRDGGGGDDLTVQEQETFCFCVCEPCATPPYGAREAFGVNDNRVVPYRNFDPEALSDSERECLDAAVEACHKLSFGKLTRQSHDAAWEAAAPNDFISLRSIAQTLPNADEVLEQLHDPYPGD